MNITRIIKHSISIACLACSVVHSGLAAEPAAKGSPNITIPVCDFTYQLEWKGRTVNDPDYWPWDLFVLKAEDGKYHGFGTRVKDADLPMSTRNPGVKDICYGHLKLAEIAHYLADKPEGPYQFVDISLPCPRDGNTKLFPSVHRDGNRWVMMYTNLRGDEKGQRGKGMSMCMAVSESLNGPWRDLGTVIEPSTDPKHWTYKSGYGFKVGKMLKFRGKWYAYFKTWVKSKEYAGDFVGVATAERPEGPWTIADKPAILKDGAHPKTYLEDLCVFEWGGKVYLVITDNLGGVSSVHGAILLFVSDDALTFPWERVKLMVGQIQQYCPGFDPKRTQLVWGCRGRYVFEGPNVLLENGTPAYFFGGGGTNVDGEPKSANYCLKIPKWAP